MIINKDDNFDNGRPFDWGLASAEYAKYRNEYPELMWKNILAELPREEGRQIKLLDLGTGTGIVARRMKQRRASLDITALDPEPEQIKAAERMCLEEGIEGIGFRVLRSEQLGCFADGSFDAATACQCFFYFDHEKTAPELARVMRPGAKLIILFFAWLPGESEIAAASERLVLKYNPQWTGHGFTAHGIEGIPEVYDRYFTVESNGYEICPVTFTREGWNGRICACRAILPSLPAERCAGFSREHTAMLENMAGESFDIPHSLAMAVLRRL